MVYENGFRTLFPSTQTRERYIIIYNMLGIKAKLPALPKLCKESAKSLYDSTFAMMGPRLWNGIPENVNVTSLWRVLKMLRTCS